MLFQSTSVIADGRIRCRHRWGKDRCWFQSTSVIADGRILIWMTPLGVASVFQSTSVIADGRIKEEYIARGSPYPVSIHVRHC